MKKQYNMHTLFLFAGLLFFTACTNYEQHTQAETATPTPPSDLSKDDSIAVFFSESDKKIVTNYWKKAKEENIDTCSLSDALIHAGMYLLNTPYQAGVLDSLPTEQLIVNLRALDCVTFVENSMCLALTARYPSPEWKDYTHKLRNIRYRNQTIDGYTSRLHYFTDWIYENEKQKIVRDYTLQAGGNQRIFNLNFMSQNTENYPLLTDSSQIAFITGLEKKISLRPHAYIPQSRLPALEKNIVHGSIIAITTNLKGLDVVHTGLAYRQKGQLYLLHASSTKGKVVISARSLAEMLKRNSIQNGIICLQLSID